MTALGIVLMVGVAAAVVWARGLGPKEEPIESPTPQPKVSARAVANEKFGPRARAQTTANVDVGIRTVRPIASPTLPATKPAKPLGSVQLAQYQPPTTPLATAVPGNTAQQLPSPSPTVAPATTPLPVLTPPTFTPLPPPPAPQGREIVVVFAKGEVGHRQLYIRAIEREKDEQLVTSVYDDFGLSLSSTAQKIAYYSNEEGPSDATRARTKLKVLDLATGKSQLITGSLPGSWPVAWSGDGKKLAIPTANSIFLADTTTGTSLQVPTGRNPGALGWAPGNLKLYFQAEAAGQQTDIFEADTITAQARPVIATPEASETYPSVSADGNQLSFLRDKPAATAGSEQSARGGQAVTVKNLASGQEQVYAQSQPTSSYLWNYELTDLIVTRRAEQSKLVKIKNKNVTDISNLGSPTIVAWDRDYQHIFVLADDDQGKALFSVDITSGQAEKVKAGISDAVPQTTR